VILYTNANCYSRNTARGAVPERMAERMAEPFSLKYVAHPAVLPEVAINAFWHAKFHKAPANQWLRGVVFDLFSD